MIGELFNMKKRKKEAIQKKANKSGSIGNGGISIDVSGKTIHNSSTMPNKSNVITTPDVVVKVNDDSANVTVGRKSYQYKHGESSLFQLVKSLFQLDYSYPSFKTVLMYMISTSIFALIFSSIFSSVSFGWQWLINTLILFSKGGI